MSDFVSNGWAWFVAGVSLVSIFACFWLAWSLANRKTPTNAAGEVETTGHVWDGNLQELNNPLPRWWLYLFYITCVFSLVYLVLYPGLGSYKGVFDWTAENQYDSEIETADARYEPLFDQYLSQDITQVATNSDAHAMGQSLYLNYCAQCHGSDARGGRSFPNLSDSDWLGTGEPDYIKSTILNGRNALMPTMASALGGEQDVENVAHYVLSLSGSNHDAGMAEAGKAKFVVCAGCHGIDGKGNAAVGAPNLTDDTWLYGGSLASVTHAINNGFQNQMPAFGERLGEGKAHVLAAYIWGLSNAPDQQASAQ